MFIIYKKHKLTRFCISKSRLLTLLFVVVLLLTPVITFAQQDFDDLINIFVGVINGTIVVAIGLALLFFFWGLMRFIMHAGDSTKREEGKQFMVWSIVAIFVMTAFLGIVRLLTNTFLPGSTDLIDVSSFFQSEI